MAPAAWTGATTTTPAAETARDHHFTPHIPPKASAEQPLPPPGHPDRHPPRRWVVEVAHSWFNRFRRLLIRWEKKADNYLALLQFAATLIVYRKLRHARWFPDRLLAGRRGLAVKAQHPQAGTRAGPPIAVGTRPVVLRRSWGGGAGDRTGLARSGAGCGLWTGGVEHGTQVGGGVIPAPAREDRGAGGACVG